MLPPPKLRMEGGSRPKDLFLAIQELILVEEDAAGSRIVYQQPSGLIAGFEGAEEPLRQAAEELDRKLEGLVRDVLRV